MSLDPDVPAVQEVGGPEPLADLLARLQKRYPHTLLSSHPNRRGIRVGFVSKLAIEASEEIVTFPQHGLPKVSSVDDRGNAVEIESF